MCTRAVYIGEDDLVITGRSMDWAEDMHSNLWLLPRGLVRDGAAGPASPTWTAKYGSLAVTAYDAGTTDGMNEAGLVMNGLYFAEADFGGPDERPAMSVMVSGQYLLDCFGSVAEAVAAVRGDAVRIIAPVLPNGKPATVHLSLSDPSGDSAILEYIGGKLIIHHGKDYRVMTNTPSFDQQLAIREYWREVNPLEFLPGSGRAADRFVRASFLIDAIPKGLDPLTITAVPGAAYEHQAVAGVLGVMRAVGVPLGIPHPTQPNNSSTLWRTIWDQKHKVLYFDSATTANAFWVPFSDLDFTAGAPVQKLTLAGARVYAGNAADKFEQAAPFPFLPADPR